MSKFLVSQLLSSITRLSSVVPFMMIPVFSMSPAGDMDACIGAAGHRCMPVNTITKDAPVSVGSIMHDNCCLVNFPNGHWCNGGGEDQEVCRDSWDKAVRNTLAGHQWRAPFTKTSSDTALVSSRRSDIQYGYETVATRRLQAPAGTVLEKVDVEFCASKQFQETAEQLQSQNFGICQ